MSFFACVQAAPVTHVLRIAGVPAIVGLTAKSFEWVESALSTGGKQTITLWLRSESIDNRYPNWLKALEHLIDRLFGERPFSWRFFLRSCIASGLFGLALMIVFTLVEYRLTIFLWESAALEVAALSYGPSFVLSFVGDYFSLLVSRKIVHWMSINPRAIRVAALLLVDTILSLVVATAIIFGQAYYIMSLRESVDANHVVLTDISNSVQAVTTFYQSYPCTDQLNQESRHHIPFCTDQGLPLGIYFYGSFGTSVWVWLYVLGGVGVRILNRTKRGWKLVSPFLDLEAKPLTAIGRVAALLLGTAYALVLGFVALISHG